MILDTTPRYMIIFPASTGLRPRPADAYDIVCRRYATCMISRNHVNARALENIIVDMDCADGSADDAYSHGITLLQCTMVAAG
jgi:hypothetical protein